MHANYLIVQGSHNSPFNESIFEKPAAGNSSHIPPIARSGHENRYCAGERRKKREKGREERDMSVRVEKVERVGRKGKERGRRNGERERERREREKREQSRTKISRFISGPPSTSG